MKISKKISFVFLITAVFVLGFWLGKIQNVYPVCFPDNVDFSVFWRAWDVINSKYLNQDSLSKEDMVYGATAGLIESLDNPYTIFLDPDEAKKFLEDAKGSFEGIGLEIGIKDNQLQAIAPLEGTPAQKAGLRAGDKIIKVDGKPTLNVPTDVVASWIRGSKDTEVILTIYREDWGQERDITLTRQTVEIPSLKLEFIKNDIAYIRLYHFSEKANYDFKEAVVNILKSPAQKIILDLRNNPGGYLNVAQDIAGWFIEKDQVVVLEDFGEGKDKRELYAEGNPKLLDYPLVVLINEGSASGSEILAGALRDNRNVLLIGESSFGKGSVQELIHLKDGYFIKITIAQWLTPKGYSIEDQGLEPDIKIDYTEEDFELDRDPQLEKAIEVINNL